MQNLGLASNFVYLFNAILHGKEGLVTVERFQNYYIIIVKIVQLQYEAFVLIMLASVEQMWST